MKSRIVAFFGLLLFTGCTPAKILCFLNFSDYSKTYKFDCSKEELKNRIIETYSYDSSLFSMMLGKTPIINEDVSKKYHKQNIWLDCENWKKFESEIVTNTTDTLNLWIGKYAGGPRQGIRLQVILGGNQNKSSLTVNGFNYKSVKKCCEKKDYRKKLSRKIKRKFINKLD